MPHLAKYYLQYVAIILVSFLSAISVTLSIGIAQPSTINPTLYNLESGLSSNYIRGILQDREGFIWIGTAYGLNRFDGNSFKHYLHDPKEPESIGDNNMWTLYEDRAGRLWIGTQRGLDLFDRDQQRFRHFYVNKQVQEIDTKVPISAIFEDIDGNLWLGSEKGLFLLDEEKQCLSKFQLTSGQFDFSIGGHILSLYQDRKKNFWVGTSSNGLFCISSQRDGVIHFQANAEDLKSLSANRIMDIFEDTLQNLWIQTFGRMHLYNPTDKSFSRYEIDISKHHNYDFEGIAQQLANDGKDFRVYSLQNSDTGMSVDIRKLSKSRSAGNNSDRVCRDRSDGLWVGLWGRGVAYISVNHHRFRHLQPDYFKEGTADQFSGKSLFERKDGNIWLGTGSGLYIYEKKTGRYQPVLAANIYDIFEDSRERLWLSNYPRNALLLDAGKPSYPVIKTYSTDPQSGKSIINGSISSFYEDSEGNIWIGTFNGLSRFHSEDKTFINYRREAGNPHSLSSNWIWCIREDSQGNIWLGTNTGLNLYNKEKDTFTSFLADKKNPEGLSDDFIFFIYPAEKGKLWLATKAGINLFDPATATAQNWQAKDGLPNNSVLGILEDQKGYIWASTMNGLARLDTGRNEIRVFKKKDGLHTNTFLGTVAMAAQDGELLFGGTDGFVMFHPDSIRISHAFPSLVFTGFNIRDRDADSRDIDGKNYQASRESTLPEGMVRLPYSQRDFSIQFSALYFQSPEKIRYKYRLLGYRDSWIETDVANRVATFTNLNPGTYTFQLGSTNEAGKWNPDLLERQIVILAPWWLSWWAFTLLGMLILSIFALILRYERRRQQLKHDLKLEHLRREKLEDMDALKSRFFANISHEFRTPLTLILGPVKELMSQLKEENSRQMLGYVYRNARVLLKLINQLLDLSRLEAKVAKLEVSYQDIVPFLNQVMANFTSMAESRNISYHFKPHPDSLYVYFDREKVEKILFNLLGNSFKYTPEGGKIEVELMVRKEFVEIAVSDTGPGISKDEQIHIFDRFYQTSNGYGEINQGMGIGLALVKEMVELHYGSISVESPADRGSCFRFRLPLGKEHFRPEEIVDGNNGEMENYFPDEEIIISNQPSITQKTRSEKDLPSVLVVEDHPDMASYIRQLLTPNFQIIEAGDGQEAWQMAISSIPDLVLSDLMMPNMDGLELCQKLKQDIRTSHIPLVLLTAKADVPARIEGFEHGADAYLTKPFHKKELVIRLQKLLEMRKKLQARYQQAFPLPTAHEAILKREDSFIQEFRGFIEENLNNEQFDISLICKELGMSRSQLYRKLKALTGDSVANYIRKIRLQKGMDMLKNGGLTVAEVAYQTGFKDPAHFSKSFKAMYGKNPSEIREYWDKQT